MNLPSENSRAAKWQNSNGVVRIEGGLDSLAADHFYFHPFIFHDMKVKEVSERKEGDGSGKDS